MNTYSNALQADIPRQRWLRIIPPILIACIISYMDRVNIAFAMPGGMDEELGITATMAGLAGGIFFIGYLFLQVPGGKIAVHGSGKKFIGWSLVAWAVISGPSANSVPASRRMAEPNSITEARRKTTSA